ncbi:MAG: hypothetical protein ACRD5K_18525, partial [Candidatus Acidiferrales bacterium]
KKSASAKKSARAKRPSPAKKSARRKRAARPRRRAGSAGEITLPVRSGFGPSSGGQSGDIEGLSGIADADSESVEELAAEGQDYEAEIVDAVEGAPDPDQSEVKTREVPENDVPEEYEDDRSNR